MINWIDLLQELIWMSTKILTHYDFYRIAMDGMSIQEFTLTEYLSGLVIDTIIIAEVFLP